MPADPQGGYRLSQEQQAPLVDTNALGESPHYLFVYLVVIQHHIFTQITGSQQSELRVSPYPEICPQASSLQPHHFLVHS